ncbi:hypothetical protein ACP4OV_010076 [Aristida adscensionis]
MDLRSNFFPALLLLVLLLPLSATASSKLYIVYMGEKKHDDPSVVTASHHDILESVFESKEEAQNSIIYSYKHGFSGFAATLTESQAKTISSLPGVISVKPNTHYKTHTTRSWDFLGLDYYQSSSSNLLKKSNYGEDVIVGVVDTGIWPESRSFDDSGYGPPPAKWKGICQTGAAFNVTSCNRKIIGARWYAGGVEADELKGEYLSPRDLNGHGTHVASTIAGGPVRNASYGGGLGAGVAHGGAPRARLAVYKACWSGGEGTCPIATVLKAIDDAIHDGVDILSLSIGGPDEYPGTLHAVARGITVVFAGGNDGPAADTVQNAVPWVLTVAASTIDRAFPTVMTLGNNERLVGQSLYYNVTLNTTDFHSLVYAGSCDQRTLNDTDVSGKVVLCSAPWEASSTRLPQGFAGAASRVFRAGGKGLIFAQHNSNILENNDIVCNGFMPCVLVDFEVAHRVQSYAATVRRPVVRISRAATVTGNGVLSPRVAAFSSRGPSPMFPRILKPDIAAPGVSILAAKRNSYVFMSGTSMACPHVSAIAALLKSVHPDWSPAMIKSAIVTTASVTDRFGMPIQAEGAPRKLADPFDYGGGHINPGKVADPGLVYDIDIKDYTKFFNCTLGLKDGCETYVGQLYQLNLPSIAVPDLKDSITVWRTVTNVGAVNATYRAVVEAPAGIELYVEPSMIKFNDNSSNKVTFQVTIKARQRVQGGYTFGSLTWLDGGNHSVRIPIAVRTVIQDFIADTS